MAYHMRKIYASTRPNMWCVFQVCFRGISRDLSHFFSNYIKFNTIIIVFLSPIARKYTVLYVFFQYSVDLFERPARPEVFFFALESNHTRAVPRLLRVFNEIHIPFFFSFFILCPVIFNYENIQITGYNYTINEYNQSSGEFTLVSSLHIRMSHPRLLSPPIQI